MRASFGPLHDFRLRELNELSRQITETLRPFNALTEHLQKYRLPVGNEVSGLLASYLKAHQTVSRNPNADYLANFRGLAESIRTPWISTVNEMQSVKGFADLYGIASAVGTLPAYELNLTEKLRLDLGDWRQVTLPDRIADDPIERTLFYDELGLNPDLTAFPNEAFEQIIADTGLSTLDIPLSENHYRFSSPKETEEEGFERTNRAHKLLMRLESLLRNYIAERMAEAFGANWMRQRIPGNILSDWKTKRQLASREDGREFPLIAYSDFSDYMQIIVRKDNWNDIFGTDFKYKSSVEESFRRLYPIRLATMHSRIITQDDELYLFVEMKRILKAIGVRM